MQTYLRVFTVKNPGRFIQIELTTHGHYKNTANCTAMYRRPPVGLEDEAHRILCAAVAGWELNPPMPKDAEQCSVAADHETGAGEPTRRRFRCRCHRASPASVVHRGVLGTDVAAFGISAESFVAVALSR